MTVATPHQTPRAPPASAGMGPSSSSSSRPSIASLPSFAHSLSGLPTMTVVTNDMVHYPTLGRTKGASEAKVSIRASLPPSLPF